MGGNRKLIEAIERNDKLRIQPAGRDPLRGATEMRLTTRKIQGPEPED